MHPAPIVMADRPWRKKSAKHNFYATLAYIRHFIYAGFYDNDPWYLVTNLAGHLDLARNLDLAGHLDLAGIIFLKVLISMKNP